MPKAQGFKVAPVHKVLTLYTLMHAADNGVYALNGVVYQYTVNNNNTE